MSKKIILNHYFWFCLIVILFRCQSVESGPLYDSDDIYDDDDEILKDDDTTSYTTVELTTIPNLPTRSPNSSTTKGLQQSSEALTTHEMVWNSSNGNTLLETSTAILMHIPQPDDDCQEYNNCTEENFDDESAGQYPIEDNISEQIDYDKSFVDQDNSTILWAYQRAFSRYENGGNKDAFEKFQHYYRELLMENMGCKIDDIEKLLQWPWIPRDENGYRIIDQPLRVPLPQNGKIYSAIQGISFNKQGPFRLHLVEVQPGDKNALFNSDDVDLIMRRGLTDLSFSLQQTSESTLPNPLQKLVWSPLDLLLDTDILPTLLHVDLWLKSIVIPAEISAKSPFHIRSFDKGFTLPSSLFYRLFLEHGLELDKNLLSSTQLWIESNPIKYNKTINGDNVTYRLGPAEMKFGYRDLIRHVRNNITGNLETDVGANDSWHKAFVAALTANYKELGQVVPELLRLGELSKLSAVSLLFQHHYDTMVKSSVPPTLESVTEWLNSDDVRLQIFDGQWPQITAERIESEIRAMSHTSFFSNHPSRTSHREIARKRLTNLQDEKIKKIIHIISQKFDVSNREIRDGTVRSYITKNNSQAKDQLINEIIEAVKQRLQRTPLPETALIEEMRRSNYDIKGVFDRDQLKLNNDSRRNTQNICTNGLSCISFVPTMNIRNYENHARDQQEKSDVRLDASPIAVPLYQLFPIKPNIDSSTPLPLGSLSAQYEIAGRSLGSIIIYQRSSTAQNGIVSYGTHQLSTSKGTINSFMSWLRKNHPNTAPELVRYTPGTDKFNIEWRKIAAENPIELRKVQHNFLKETHYDKTIAHLSKIYKMNLTLDVRSPVVRDVVWSTSIQHGALTGSIIIQRALNDQDLKKLTDRQMINYIYAERQAEDGKKYFSKASDDILKNLLNRLQNERNDALKQIKE